MNDLRSFAVLQARVYEFLAQQDENTLQAIISGEVRLAVLDTDAEAAADITGAPSSDPFQAASDLSRLASEQERQIYLNKAGLSVKGLKAVAKLCGVAGYSKLTRSELINLLVDRSPDQALVGERGTQAPSGGLEKPDAEVAAIASRLRETETEDEGAAYLQALHLDRESLLAVAAELQLTRVDRLSQKELRRRVLKQAIGARRKFAGLRKW